MKLLKLTIRNGSVICIAVTTMIIILTSFSCSTKSPYIGKSANLPSLAYRTIDNKEVAFGIRQDKWFVFDYKITPTDNVNEFLLEGTIDASKGEAKSWTHLTPGKCRFTLLLSSFGEIIKTVSFSPKGSDLSRPLGFKKVFTCDDDEVGNFYSEDRPFQGSTVSWRASVRG